MCRVSHEVASMGECLFVAGAQQTVYGTRACDSTLVKVSAVGTLPRQQYDASGRHLYVPLEPACSDARQLMVT